MEVCGDVLAADRQTVCLSAVTAIHNVGQICCIFGEKSPRFLPLPVSEVDDDLFSLTVPLDA